MTSMCPSCGRPEHDGLLCQRCTRLLSEDLHRLPEWLGELETTMSRQTSKTPTIGGKSSDTPPPANLDALNVYSYVRNQLQTWVRELDLGDGPMADNPRAWINWLAARVQRMRMHVAVDELISEIDYCHKLIRRVVDRAVERIYVGECGTCGRAIHAAADADVAACRRCQDAGVVVPEVSVIPRRAELLKRAEDQDLSAASLLHLIDLFWQIKIPRRTFRSWVERDQLKRTNPGQDEATYRVGDVLALAQAREAVSVSG